ncbi:MAG: AIPR family protein [Terriglobales bacterium]
MKVDIHTLRHEVKEVQDKYPAWTLDNAFVHWFVRAFLVAEDEVAAKAVTGVSHDKGVDAIFIDDNAAKVFVLQGKCHLGDKAPLENRSDVLAFAKLAQTITSTDGHYENYRKTLDALVADKLDHARQRVRRRNYVLHLYYVTSGNCSSPLKDEAESDITQANGFVDLSILDRRDILALLTDYLRGAAPPVPFLDLKIDASGVVGSDGVIQRFDETTGIESWIFTMSGKDAGELYATARDRLFARNIRGFLGDTAINEGMRDTLTREAEHFWYFNNGITIVCNSARKTAEHGTAVLRVANPQVINGQQTTRMLNKTPQKRAGVLVRVISIPRDKDNREVQFEQLVSSIVAATNWQNAILPSDLRSNDTIQVALEREMARMRYHYLRKRQTKAEARRMLGGQHYFRIKKEELAQAVAACEFDPEVVRSGKEGLFKDQYYRTIFDGRPAYRYLAAYWLSRAVKYNASGYPDRSYAKWHVLHFVWRELGSVLQKRRTADLFIAMYERRGNRNLNDGIRLVYLAILDFYRRNRGKGARAVDISNFFYRSKQHDKFEHFWHSPMNKRRTRANKMFAQFRHELTEE